MENIQGYKQPGFSGFYQAVLKSKIRGKQSVYPEGQGYGSCDKGDGFFLEKLVEQENRAGREVKVSLEPYLGKHRLVFDFSKDSMSEAFSRQVDKLKRYFMTHFNLPGNGWRTGSEFKEVVEHPDLEGFRYRLSHDDFKRIQKQRLEPVKESFQRIIRRALPGKEKELDEFFDSK